MAESNKCPNCESNIDEGLDSVYAEMADFIEKKEDWKRFSAPVICFAMLEAVMDFVFHVAPSKAEAQQVVDDVNKLYYKQEARADA